MVPFLGGDVLSEREGNHPPVTSRVPVMPENKPSKYDARVRRTAERDCRIVAMATTTKATLAGMDLRTAKLNHPAPWFMVGMTGRNDFTHLAFSSCREIQREKKNMSKRVRVKEHQKA